MITCLREHGGDIGCALDFSAHTRACRGNWVRGIIPGSGPGPVGCDLCSRSSGGDTESALALGGAEGLGLHLIGGTVLAWACALGRAS